MNNGVICQALTGRRIGFGSRKGIAVSAMNPGKLELLALAVAKGEPISDAGQALDLSERTAYRWAGRSDFKARVDSLRREMVAGAIGKLSDAAASAVGTLVELLGVGHPPTVRCSAARSLLTTLIDVQSHFELSERVG